MKNGQHLISVNRDKGAIFFTGGNIYFGGQDVIILLGGRGGHKRETIETEELEKGSASAEGDGFVWFVILHHLSPQVSQTQQLLTEEETLSVSHSVLHMHVHSYH